MHCIVKGWQGLATAAAPVLSSAGQLCLLPFSSIFSIQTSRTERVQKACADCKNIARCFRFFSRVIIISCFAVN